MSEELQRHARSFGGVADAYDRGRPTYPEDAVTWLLGGVPGSPTAQQTVLELGAGTGKLTRTLVDLGHDVHATDPDEAMLAILRRDLPDVRTSVASAEDIPTTNHSVDVVIAAQCYHWFDHPRALDEINRVLRPGGLFAVVWHERDERIPWVRKLGRIIGTQDQQRDPAATIAASTLFHEVEAEVFKHWQVVDRRSIQDLARSRSNLAVLSEHERERVITELLALYDDYGRGMDGMQLPYRTLCFRTLAAERPAPVVPEPEPEAPDPGAPALEASETGADRPEDPATEPTVAMDPPTSWVRTPAPPASIADSAATIPRVAVETDDDTAMLLIDFR